MSLNDFRSVIQTLTKVQPDEIYNLAGQSSVGLSFDQPVETLESIATGTLNLLEAIRFTSAPIRLYNAGSSECFGDTGALAADEQTPFRPRSLRPLRLLRHPLQPRISSPPPPLRHPKNHPHRPPHRPGS
jgi:GDPmannose 4,6-dehydratase